MIARIEELTYRYPGRTDAALAHVSLEIAEGSYALVAGPSAGGKSTFLRLFNGLVPQFHGGRLEGALTVAGLDPSRTASRRMATVAGMVFQEPEAQAIADTVEDEIAFGMEQHGVAPELMRRRIDRLLGELGIEHLLRRRLATLSGGERQRVAIAAVLALEPRMLLLDEPTSQLDTDGAEAVLALTGELHRRGMTVLIAEHRLERLLPVVDSVIEVEGGRVRALSPREAANELRSVPPVCELGRRLALKPVPLTVGEFPAGAARARQQAEQSAATGAVLIGVEGATVAYGENVALRDASLTVREGEIVALMGANGSGKTTLFRAIAGLSSLVSGAISFNGRRSPASVADRTALAGLVPQDPAIALYRDTVAEELADTLKARGRKDIRNETERSLEAWNVAELRERNPRDISVGQQQRVAIGAMLAHEPRIWLLDEPTRGADGEARAWLARRLREHAANGGAAIVSTHDVESAATYATRVVGLEGGRVAFDLPARKAFAANGPLPTQVARIVPGAVVAGDVL